MITRRTRKRRLISNHSLGPFGDVGRLFRVFCHPFPIAPTDNGGSAVNADHAAFGGQSLPAIIRDSDTRYRSQRFMAGNDWSATRLDELHLHGFSPVSDIESR